jgi:hypothetical protein
VAATSAPKTLVELANSFLALAREEAAIGYATEDRRRVRDAAEKAWLAALQATDAAMERHGLFPDPGPMAHASRHEFLEKRGRRDLSSKLHEFADRLHGKYFYLGAVPDKAGMGLTLDEVAEYIRRVSEEI